MQLTCLTCNDSFLPLLWVRSAGKLLQQNKNICLGPSLSSLHAPVLLPTRDVRKHSCLSAPAKSKELSGLALTADRLQASTLAALLIHLPPNPFPAKLLPCAKHSGEPGCLVPQLRESRRLSQPSFPVL